MATIVTRETGATAKGSPLTNAELDNNFINLNTELGQTLHLSGGTVTGPTILNGNVSIKATSLNGSGYDFNNITYSGFYNLYNTSSATNAPSFPYGTMIVAGSNKDGTTFATQIATERASNQTLIRAMTDGANAWTAWSEIAISTRSFTNSVDLRAPVFYDSNNTSYYIDPASTSNLYALNVGGYRAITSQQGSRYSTNFNTIIDSGHYNADATPTNSPTGSSYGQLLMLRGIDTGLQIYGGYNNENLWFRGYGYGTAGDGFWPWRKILHDNNYTSYAMPAGASATNSVDVRAPLFYDSNNTSYYADFASTSTSINTAGDIVSNSDINLKENIEPITNAIAKIRMINGVTYNKIGETHRTAGVIAQDVEAAQPELVTQQGKYKSVAYGNMAGLFVEGIKEHDDTIESLKQEIADLRALVKQLLDNK